MNKPAHQYDVLIIGSGAAGLTLALKLPQKLQVAILSKSRLSEGNTLYAQGGISAVLSGQDSLQSHVQDTLKAGAGLCDEAVVQFVVERGPGSIQWLADAGVAFTRVDDQALAPYHLTQEGGHSHRRVIHAQDATGHAVETTLEAKVRASSNIHIFEDRIAVDVITASKFSAKPEQAWGAYVYDIITGQVEVFSARCTILATGGASKVYLYTSNPDVATGDGIAMAGRAGARIANMEFMQFHPTCLFHPRAKSELISEAVRGEGGRLLLPNGEPFMHDHHPEGELAPRDIVARAIDHEMKKRGLDCVYLDISHKSTEFIEKHFPNINARCKEYGFDMSRDPLPVVPAAHYTCGGVVSDLFGQTNVPQLYAIGETACTGLHGANRMASNSLLECLVFADSAATHIKENISQYTHCQSIPDWDDSRVTDSDEEVVVSHNWEELRRFMWDYVGIVRTNKRLQRARARINLLSSEIEEYYGNFRVSNDLLELRNLVTVADLIVRSALARNESRGLHYTLDYPELAEQALNSIVSKQNTDTELNSKLVSERGKVVLKLPLIIEADALPEYLNNPAVRIIDLCGDDSYQQQHIPNAVHIDYTNLISAKPPVGGLLPDEHQFAELMGHLGIDNDTPIIAYDDEGGGKAARLLWTLHVFGHNNNSMLNGGLTAWLLTGGEVNNAPSQVQSTEFTIKRNNKATADAEYILQHLNDSDFALLDARSPAEYDGSLVRSAQGGHIPGAINYEWTRAMDANQLRKMRSKAELQQELTELGFNPQQNIVTYCQTHHRSAYTWLMLRWLGYDKAKGYPGSWSDWGNRTDTPLE